MPTATPTIEQALYNCLAADPGIAAIAGTGIYPVVVPEDATLPALTYQIISSVSDPGFQTSGMARVRVEINCWGQRYADVVGLRAAVVAALNGYQDQNFAAFLLTKQDFYENELLEYRSLVEFYLLTDIP